MLFHHMLLYIDPGTGSMLFAILIGIIGALNYLVRTWLVKLRFLLSGGKSSDAGDKKAPLVIFSEDKRYWTVFRSICAELDRKGLDTVYMTASPDDPALNSPFEHVKTKFIGENNKALAYMNLVNASIVLSTTPGLEVYQWKRSRSTDYYVHIPHAPGDITIYRMFGVDYYDAVLLSGDFQETQIRSLEKLRGLPAKELVQVGIPYMDDMAERLKTAPPVEKKDNIKTVLLAPSWGPSAIFSKYGGKIIDILLETEYRIIVRPHPQSFRSEAEMIEKLMEQYPESDRLSWNRDTDNFDVLRTADILISDFSGVIFDFSLVYDKPVIYTDTHFDKSIYDAWWLKDDPLQNLVLLPYIGMQLTEDNFKDLKSIIEECLTDLRFSEGRCEARSRLWVHEGEGAVRAADYLYNKYKELTAEKNQTVQKS